MLADAFPERTSPQSYSRRRAAIAAIVALVHLIFLYGLMNALNIRAVPKLLARVPITIWMPLPPRREPDKKKPQPAPTIEAPAAREFKPAPITVLPVPARPRSSDEDGIGRLGRYLNNCSAGNYSALTAQEWANCLGGMATRDQNTVRLGDVRTLWEAQHPLKEPPSPKDADGFVECARNSPNHNLGLPCFQHDGERPSVSNGQQ